MPEPAANRSGGLPWPIFVAVALVLVPLPELPHFLAPDAFDTAQRLDPGNRQYVHATLRVFAGDTVAGRVVAKAGPPVMVYIMDDEQVRALQTAGIVEALLAATGADVNFSFPSSLTGQLHLLVGHTPGNESTESALRIQARVAANPLLLGTLLAAEAAGALLFVFSVRRYAKEVLRRREEERRERREGRGRKRRRPEGP